MTGLNLSGDDKAKIRAVVMDEGWRALIEKVWEPYQQALAYRCATQSEDHRYNQGFYAGFAFARQYAESAAKTEEELQLPYSPSEADLVARRGRSRE